MDSDLIYAKTASGEEAMVQRALVTQRNLRMILILVDGQSTVADLCLKTGNVDLTTEALSELEKGGFIELVVDQDSLWIESKKVEQEIRAAASQNAHQLRQSSKPPFSRPRPSVPDARVFVHSTPQHGPETSNFSISQYSAAPVVVGRAVAGESPRALRSERRSPTRLFSAIGTAASAITQGIKGTWRSTAASDRVAPLKEVRHSRFGTMSWLLKGLIAFVVIVVLAFLTIFFFPYDSYLPEIESAFTQAVGKPVKVVAMNVTVYPNPALILGDVRIGSGKDEIRVSQMRLQPSLSALAAPRKAFHTIVVSGVTLSAEAILGVSKLAASSVLAGVDVEQLGFEKTDIVFGERVFTGLQGKADLSAQGTFRAMSLSSADRKLSLLVTPTTGDRLDFIVEAAGWRPSPDSPFFFDSLKIQGDIDRKGLTIRSMDLRIWEGLVNGVAVFETETRPAISGEIRFERINAERLFATLGMDKKITGETAGKLAFSTTSDSWATILSNINADGEFTMRRGSLRGIDLAEAVRRARKEPVQGGATAFEQLSGKIRLTATRYQLSGLVLSSGLMQSTGRLEVGKDSKVAGNMELRIQGTMNQTSVPISIDGSFENPIVKAGGRH
jgi:hypothetical protein